MSAPTVEQTGSTTSPTWLTANEVDRLNLRLDKLNEDYRSLCLNAVRFTPVGEEPDFSEIQEIYGPKAKEIGREIADLMVKNEYVHYLSSGRLEIRAYPRNGVFTDE